MNTQTQLSQLGLSLVDSLHKIDTYERNILANKGRETIRIPTVGSAISTAYEQLRNASEFAEDELLQQRAIRRYLKRELSFHTKIPTNKLAEELVTELTQAEYLQNDHTTKSDIKAISDSIKVYYGAYWKYVEREPNYTKRTLFQNWILDVLAVRAEQTLQSHFRQLMFAHFAFSYLNGKVPMKKMVRGSEKIKPDDYTILLYIAIHSAILKSDQATIRVALLDSYRIDINNPDEFVTFNQRVDKLASSKTAVYTARIVSTNGATLRFIYTGFYNSDSLISTDALKSPETLEYALRQHIEQEYSLLNRRLDRGIIRSIFFLLITKSVIGIAVEVPFDILVTGAIIWVPLIINLFFPSVFIALSRLTLSTPINRNTESIINQAINIFFKNDHEIYKVRIPKGPSSIGFNFIYAISFIIAFTGLSYILYLLDFNIIQGIIFFIFLSTASFLSFRLSRQIHELEVVHTSQGSLSLIRDIIYMPFIFVGQQISYHYSQVNIVATILDILIELPLKTILRLVRQWVTFLNAKKDELI
ncbi:MAG: hypothetical protein WAW80_03080 [Candidatus Saccharimonadales bacterium]